MERLRAFTGNGRQRQLYPHVTVHLVSMSNTANTQNEADTSSGPAPVTRIEILDATGHAFDNPPVSREDLLEQAVAHNARPPVLELLRQLPEEKFRQRSDLWTHLADVPIDE